MPPIVSIVGKSKSGKTALLEKLLRELTSRGYRVATIKHTPQDMSFGEPDKDSWRHLEAGSQATAVSSRDKIMMIKSTPQEPGLIEVARLLGEDYDLILTEGFKYGRAPKIEVHRRQVGPPLEGITKLIAMVTDEALETRARQFSLEDVKGLADLLEEGFIKPQRERITLYVNDAPVPLTAFPREAITNVVLALAASLKGLEDIRSLEIRLRREPGQERESAE